MTNQFFCKNKNRLKLIATESDLNGIDYLEVDLSNPTILYLHFIRNILVPEALASPLDSPPDSPPESPPIANILKKDNIFIEGGVRIRGIKVQNISADQNVLTISVDKEGDFSNYTLKIGNSQTDVDNPPSGFDEQLSSIDFSFKINCPAEFDCKTDDACLPDKVYEPSIDYLAKDYASFNRLMLDRLSVIMPGWKERNAADLQVALVELLAYAGDHLSYYQDAVATEAYLATARRRISLRRHARLLDYFVHDGCNSRAWVHIAAGARLTIPEKAALMTNGIENRVSVNEDEVNKFINEQDPVVFETMHTVTLSPEHNQISFYTWGDTDCCLPKGSTKATLSDHPTLSLVAGDVLILEELYGPETGAKADADPSRRHAVRLIDTKHGVDPLTGTAILKIEWYEKDMLPFALCLTSAKDNDDFDIPVNEKSVARGNIVLADNGLSVTRKKLIPSSVTPGQTYYPTLPQKNITSANTYKHNIDKYKAATNAMVQDAHASLPVIRLTDASKTWEPKRDLLGSDRFANEFVTEIEVDGTAFLRFGDNILGKKPATDFNPDVNYRIGNGKTGNVGANAINTVVWNGDGILKVRNPMAASGGTDAETMDEVRQFAPQAFRTQERAVTEQDYVQKTELHPDVQKAAAKFYWTGSWYTVYLIIDRKGGKEINDAFKDEIKLHLEQYRMAGYDLEIRQPLFVPLNIALNVCVKPGYFKTNVRQTLLQVFSNDDLPGGGLGFFHPDQFTFGQSVYLSAIYRNAMSVAGVDAVEIKEFKRWAKLKGDEINQGLIAVSELEIIRCDNDRNFPENGKIDFIMLSGL